MARRLGVLVVGLAVAGLWGCSRVEAQPEGTGGAGSEGIGVFDRAGTGGAEAFDETAAALARATVTVGGRCAGVVATGGVHVVTAAHCLMEHEDAVPLALHDGTPAMGVVAHVDREADVAVLFLESPVAIDGLSFSDELPDEGSAAYFAGRFDRGATLQAIMVERLAPCPSLPGVPRALHTSLRGVPGDSGAPVVDGDLRVVGLVHGGARCSIAAPTHGVPAMLELLSPQ